MTTLALTDRDTVAGTVRFATATAAAAAGIRPVFGVDVAVLRQELCYVLLLSTDGSPQGP